MRLLIIEDELKIAQALKKGLEHESFAVDMVHTGQEGLDMAVGEEYDAIILDVMLPGKDGIAVCQEIRANKIHTPILMLTAKGQIEDRVTGLNIGADDYLVKPFAFSELIARIHAITRRTTVDPSTILTLDNLTFNTATHEVKRGEQPIRLSNKEYSLLRYLLQRKNTIVTKDQILQHVWDYDADVLPNSVEVYIRHLRQKIDTSNQKPLIHTTRGFGYSLSEEA